MSYIQEGGGGGGGTGTVTNTGGALTANAVVLGAGGADTKVSTGITSNGASEVDLGIAGGATGVLGLNGSTSGKATLTAPAVAGTIANAVALSNSLTVGGPQVTISAAGAGNGVLALSGNTSGTATLTAPAVAGTAGNPVLSSNAIQLPDGTKALPALRLTTSADGWYRGSTLVNSWVFASTTVDAFALGPASTPRIGLNSSGAISFGSSATVLDAANMNGDIFIGRGAAGVLRLGATFNTTTGLIQTGMSTFVTANFTTSGVGTALEAITGLSITVPALAANWTFHAHLAYSQAVGAAAVAFGIQAVTNNPTNIFATGELYTASGTVTTGVLATLATTTATNIVSGTPGATATNFVCDLHGTCELAATANTIRLLVSTSTAADLVTILRGSYFHFNC